MTRRPTHMPMTARRTSGGRCRRAFTIVELLVAIFIIGLLITISMFVISKARRTAAAARVKADFVAVGMALDQFKADHKSYPGMVPNVPPNVDVHNALAYCLMSPGNLATDGADGPGFRYQTSTTGTPAPVKQWPAYLDSSKFKVVQRPTLPDGTSVNRGTSGWELLDAYETPIVYLPRRKPAVRPNVGLIAGLPDSKNVGAYDTLDVNGLLDKLATGDGRLALLLALGDRNANGVIDAGETANTAGDYILMSAGPDRAYFTGSDATAFQKADDVYNFDR